MMALTRITMALLVCAIAAVQAQDDLAEESVEVRRYTVEMIIFRYAQDVSTGSERFYIDQKSGPDLPPEEERVQIGGEPVVDTAPKARVYRDIEFTRLAEGDLTMGEIMRRLRRLDAYEPLMHFAWTQATWPDEDTLPIRLSTLGRPPPQLDGTLRLYLSRFLHLVVDLELDAPPQRSRAGAGARARYGDNRSPDESGSANDPYEFDSPPALRYRISENRIFKSGDLRYFDHPKFGVLAKIVRVEGEPEDALETAETELLGYPAQ